MAEVASASVSILPTFKGGAKELERVMGPALDRAGDTAGHSYGTSFVSGLLSSSAIRNLIGAGGVGAVLFAGINRYKAIDTATAKLRGLGNEAATVDQIMSNALASVKGTAFGLGDAVTVAAQLTAAQIPAGQQLEGVLKSVVNSAAAAGSSLTDMGSIYAKVASLGKAQNDVLQQVADRGIPIYQALSDQMGVTTDDIFKMASAGEIGFAEFSKAMTDAGGTVASEMGTTLSGRIDNTVAAVGRLGAAFVSSGLEEGKDVLSELTDVIDGATPAAKVLGDAMGATLSVVNAIPGPIKAAALAVVALNLASRTNTFSTLRTSVVGAAGSFRALRTDAMLAGATMPGVRVGLATVASTARATGSALLGAFGGPVGLAIAGVGLAVGGLITLWQDGAAAADTQKAAVDELTSALRSNSEETVTNALTTQVAEALPLLDQLGLKYGGIVEDIRNGGEQTRELLEQTRAVRDQLGSAKLFEDVNVDEVKAATQATSILEAALNNYTSAQKQAARETDATGAAAAGAAEEFTSMSDAVDAAFGGLSAVAGQSTAIRNLAESIRDNGNMIDATTQGGIANLEALQGTISAMAANSGDDYGTFVGNVSGLMQYLDQSGVNTQNVMGAVRAAVANVAGKRWAMYFDGSQAIGEANQVVRAMRVAVAAAAAASKAGIGALGGALMGAAASAVTQYNRAVAAAAAANSYVGSTFKGVQSAAGGASGSVSKAGKSAAATAKDMRALRAEIYLLAREWLKPTRYSSEAVSILEKINDAYREGAIRKSSRDSLVASVKRADLRLQAIAVAREKKAQQIDDANQRLQEAIEARASFRQSIIDGFRDLGDLTRFAEQTEKTITEVFTQGDRLISVTRTVQQNGSAKDMIAGLRGQVAEAKKFKSALNQLQKLGLNDTSLQNLLTQFLSSGDSSIAASLASGGKSAVGEVNDLMKELGNLTGTETKGWAKDLAEDLFGAGVDTAKGFLKGLQAQDSALKKQYEKMADTLVETIKKKLGIKSPSRVMAGLAEYTSQGWNDNIHLDPVTPGIDVTGMSSTFGGGSSDGRNEELWLMVDGEPIAAIIDRRAAGEARAKIAARRGGKRQ